MLASFSDDMLFLTPIDGRLYYQLQQKVYYLKKTTKCLLNFLIPIHVISTDQKRELLLLFL